jgi:hypothetical protein
MSPACPRCHATFVRDDDFKEHLRLPPGDLCPLLPTKKARDPEDGISAEVAMTLRGRKSGSKVDSWDGLWRILFPMDKEPLSHRKLIRSIDYILLLLTICIGFEAVVDVKELEHILKEGMAEKGTDVARDVMSQLGIAEEWPNQAERGLEQRFSATIIQLLAEWADARRRSATPPALPAISPTCKLDPTTAPAGEAPDTHGMIDSCSNAGPSDTFKASSLLPVRSWAFDSEDSCLSQPSTAANSPPTPTDPDFQAPMDTEPHNFGPWSPDFTRAVCWDNEATQFLNQDALLAPGAELNVPLQVSGMSYL